MLQRLISDRNSSFQHLVISLTDLGIIGYQLQKAGFAVQRLDLDKKPWNIVKLIWLLRRIKPDLVQTWLYHGDLIGGVAARLTGISRIIWGIHNTTLDRDKTKLSTLMLVPLCAWLSRYIPHKIVACAQSTKELHRKLGYAEEKFAVIPNGIDTEVFRPNPLARISLCQELGIDPEFFLIGMLARFAPQKDHPNFLKAAEILVRQGLQVRFILAGQGLDASNTELKQLIRGGGLEGKVYLLGQRADVEKVQAGLDLVTLSSAYGEAFPLVIAESMACGTPVVATDLGDCRGLIGDHGDIVPIKDPQALAQAWLKYLQMDITERTELGLLARAYIQTYYELDKVRKLYSDLYQGLYQP